MPDLHREPLGTEDEGHEEGDVLIGDDGPTS